MKQFLDKLKNKQDLTFDESKSAFEVLMTGKANDDEIYNFLTLLSDKGEVADEISGGVFVLRNKSKRVKSADPWRWRVRVSYLSEIKCSLFP